MDRANKGKPDIRLLDLQIGRVAGSSGIYVGDNRLNGRRSHKKRNEIVSFHGGETDVQDLLGVILDNDLFDTND